MAKKRAKRSSPPKSRGDMTRCRLTNDPQARQKADARTDAIAPVFPPGLSKPALRALDDAGLKTLDHLTRVAESELAALHGMGPKGVAMLKAALAARGLSFRLGTTGSRRRRT